jgi:hypothetical protein
MTARAFFSGLSGSVLAKETHYVSASESPRVIVLTGSEGASTRLQRMCEALEIEIITVTSHHDLPLGLHHMRPMAVISELDPQSLASCAALRCIASYDQDMPVLLVAGDDPAVLGTIDAAQELWKLSGLHRLAAAPAPGDLIHFFYQAGRHSGLGRLMPIAIRRDRPLDQPHGAAASGPPHWPV